LSVARAMMVFNWEHIIVQVLRKMHKTRDDDQYRKTFETIF